MIQSSKINILIVTVRADIGGGPEHIYQLTKRLTNDFDFYFATPNDAPYFERFLKMCDEKKIILVPHRKFNINTLFDLIEFVKKNEIQIVHSHGKGAGIYSRLIRLFIKVKIIHTFHGIHVNGYNSIIKFFYLKLEKGLSFLTSKFINVSYGEEEQTIKYKIAPRNKLNVIENGVEIPENIIDKSNFYQSLRTIISFSRFDYHKNTKLLISIALSLKKLDRLNDFKFVVYGLGPEFDIVKNLINENNLANNIFLLGSTIDTKKGLFNSFCYLSTSRWEGLPLGILEAFSCGLPVIASNVVGNNDLIDNGIDGFLFDLNKPEIAAENLIQLASDKELWLKLSKNARSKAENNYNIEQMVSKTKQLYLNILK